jgi:hypothetical protein
VVRVAVVGVHLPMGRHGAQVHNPRVPDRGQIVLIVRV